MAMTNNKSTNAPNRGASRPTGQRGPATAQTGRAQGQGQPQGRGQRPARPGTIDDAINKALTGRVNVTPAKAVEMAGQLYHRGQYAQAERVCRQIINSRPANADAHNILGVSLQALGGNDQAV